MKHLEWLDIEDFTPGLHTRNPLTAPTNGALVMTDCYPAEEGGLRAFYRLDNFSTAGLGPNDRIVGFYSRGGVTFRSPSTGAASDMYLMAYRTTTNQPILYRWDLSNDITPQTSWQAIKIFSASPGFNTAQFQTYFTDDFGLNVYVAMSYDAVAGDGQGLYRIRYSDGQVTKVSADVTAPFVIHQDRMVALKIDQRGSRVEFTSPASENFDSGSEIPVGVAQGGFIDAYPSANLPRIQWMEAQGPDILVLGREGSPFIVVQGELNDPIVREVGDSFHSVSRQTPTRMPEGIVYQSPTGGIVATDTGMSFQPLSDRLNPANTVRSLQSPPGNLGRLEFIDPFLWTPFGLIYDRRTGAWFQTSYLDRFSRIGRNIFADKAAGTGGRRIFIGTVPERNILILPDFAEGSAPRRHQYTWRSGPLQRPDRREVRVRQIDVYMDNYWPGATVLMSVFGQGIAPLAQRTHTLSEPGQQKLTFRYDHSDEVVTFQIEVDSGHPHIEAPRTRRISIGTLPGHLTDRYSAEVVPFATPLAPVLEEEQVPEAVPDHQEPVPGEHLALIAGDLDLDDEDIVSEWGFTSVTIPFTVPPVFVEDAVNGHPAVRLIPGGTTNDWLTGVIGTDEQTSGVLMVVAALDDTAESGQALAGIGPGVDPGGVVLFGEKAAYTFDGVNAIVTDNDMLEDETFALIEVHADGNEWKIFVNGVEEDVDVFLGTNSGTWFRSAYDTVMLGTAGLSAIEVAEVHIWGNPSPGDVTALRASLMAKYDL